MINLVPMIESDFQSYHDKAIDEYAGENVESGRWSVDEAYESAKKTYQKLLPDGLATPNHYLYTLTDKTTQVSVGMLWFALEEKMGQHIAFIYDIAIYSDFRRQGYASQTLTALEDHIQIHGVQQISLHVFGHNQGARALYKKFGYVETSIMMSKSLDVDEG